MAIDNLQDKLNKIISNQPSRWLEDAKWRQENKAWLKRSQAIALKILDTLDKQDINQKELAEKMNVSPQQVNKILKGKENLTLETISKLEAALGVELFDINVFVTKFNRPVLTNVVMEKGSAAFKQKEKLTGERTTYYSENDQCYTLRIAS